MDGFKKVVKMKTGGAVKPAEYVTRKQFKQEEVKDVAADKQMAKKGVSQHESFLHKGEPKTELALKKGGRAKKAVGTVSKYKCGGKVKKMADGGGVLDALGAAGTGVRNAIMGTPAQNDAAKIQEAKYLRAKQLQRAAGTPMGPGEQMATALAGAGQQMQPAPAAPAPAAIPAQKKGGKVKKAC